ncbi:MULTISPECIES: LysE family translocator [unclassified Stenotrophomonas]|jgi:threonine/homoserine/homoserine lactone efflux protein|uniref:LysE family translocator n=1 Tax=unclassified Stenotrophomonas TaxID=196198 RepID=UPI00371DE43D
MPDPSQLLAFSLIALGMVLTPGPNMIYLVSRSICQGRVAGLVSLGGIAVGLLVYLLCAVLGISALFMAVPHAYDTLRVTGALYLLYLAWQALRPGGRSPFELRALPQDSPRRLFAMGLFTALLNPKIAVLYLSLLPQFIQPHDHGSVMTQSLLLGSLQIATSISVNAVIVLAAGSIAASLAGRPRWQVVQRALMGTVLGGLAVRMLVR